MFCPKCGKKNDDNSLFCTWCGAGFGSVSTQSLSAAPAASAPVEAPATHQELQTVSAAPIVSAENSQAAQSAGEVKPEPTEQPAYSVPTPGVIPQSSAEHTAAQTSASGALNAQAAPDSAANLLSFNNEVPVASAQKPEKERRYFTAAHIAICLAVTGVIFPRYSDTTFQHAFNALPVMSGGVLFFGMIMHKNPGFVLFHFNNLAFCKLTFFRRYSILNLDISIIKVCVRFDYREYYDPFGRIT